MTYRHEQIGRMLAGLLGIVTVFVSFTVLFTTGSVGYAALLFTFMVFVCIASVRLTIDVEPDAVRWGLTFGWPGGRVELAEIVAIEIVPITWWYGIGIHLAMRGWVWNVSLGRGVQIHRCEGLPVVLGTDDPEGLLAAIERARAA